MSTAMRILGGFVLGLGLVLALVGVVSLAVAVPTATAVGAAHAFASSIDVKPTFDAAALGPFPGAASATITVGTTATPITVGDGCHAIYCDNNSTTSVFLGGASVGTSGLCISKNPDNCPRRDMPANYRCGALFARVASGTQAVNCLVGRASR
jgi:hypothetical protein